MIEYIEWDKLEWWILNESASLDTESDREYVIGRLRKDIPAADVQPVKHGRWVSIGHKLSRICSVCDCDEPYKFADDDANVYKYCPNCGAKMDGEKNG